MRSFILYISSCTKRNNTAVTFNDLETIVKQVQNSARIKLILDEVAPLAEKIYDGTPCSTYDAETLLEKLRAHCRNISYDVSE